VNIQGNIKILDLDGIKLKEMGPLEIFTRKSKFAQLKEILLCAKDHQFFENVFQAAPALELLTTNGNFKVIKRKLGIKRLTFKDSKSDFPEILEPQIQLRELTISNLQMDQQSNTNFTNFFKYQEEIEAVKFTLDAVPLSDFAAVFKHVFNLNSLRSVSLKILEDDIEVIRENMPAANIKNLEVEQLKLHDVSANLLSHSLQLFPAVSSLKVGID
jgi:hypothetical protein